MRRVPMFSLYGELIEYLEMPDEIIPPAEPTPDESRDLLLAQLLENQLLMLNGMNDLVKI